MRIGIDFDNTIVGYDRVFHRVAREAGLIPPELPVSKRSVRDYLRRSGLEERWTEIQGEVYGTRMAEAEPFPGVLTFLRRARDHGVRVTIISHKTRYPFLGPRHDLHHAARLWIEMALRDRQGPLVTSDQVFFELTQKEKLARIDALQCSHFIDDLPEILLAPEFPPSTQPLLFSPDDEAPEASALRALPSWKAISDFFEASWTLGLQRTH
ncbi:MAG TPA: haloacid dehalogenase-like hydrolase [Alphaproteobacteria bacterium]|nr:haloacid dehalogenase-like hydrolase [Alphaproteobacteria bacterium]